MQLHKRAKLQSHCVAAIADLRDRYRQRAALWTCPVHRQPATVTVTGTRLETAQVNIKGCCAEFVRAVRERLRAEE